GMRKIPQATFAYSAELDGDGITVGREVDGGTVTYRLPLPALVTADLRLNEPRFPSLPGIMKAKRKPLETLSPDDLDGDFAPRVSTVRFEMPPERAAGVIVGSVDELVAKLRDEVKII